MPQSQFVCFADSPAKGRPAHFGPGQLKTYSPFDIQQILTQINTLYSVE